MAATSSYSKLVKLLKIALPLGGTVILLTVLAWPFIKSKTTTPIKQVDSSSPAIVENRMIRPKYASTDKKGRPFQVEADWGKPTEAQETHEVDLTTPHGKLTTEEHGDVILDAKQGHYNKDTQILHLTEDVNLVTEDGYHFVTDQADVNMENRTVEGSLPITGSGPTGDLSAQKGFKLEETEGGNRIITLKGPSRVTIHPSTLKKVGALQKVHKK